MPEKGPSRITVLSPPLTNPRTPSNWYTFRSPSTGLLYSLNPTTSTLVRTTWIGFVSTADSILAIKAEEKSITFSDFKGEFGCEKIYWNSCRNE